MCEDAKKEMEQLIQGIRTMLEEDADIKRLFIRKTGAGPQVEIAGVGKVSLEEAEKLVGKDVRWSRGERGRVPKHMLGANGTQVSSKTTWKNGKTERIDVENPLPGKRPGQIHYHDAHNNKYYYDTDDKLFYNQKTGEFAPKGVQKLLKGNSFANGIKKALKVLGEQYE